MFARDVQTLVPVWGELTTSEVRRVIGLVQAAVKRPNPDLLELEGALAILACLFTGRRLKELHQSRLTIAQRWPEEDPPPGLVRAADNCGWWLPAGKPPSASAEQYVWIPAPELLTECLRIATRLRAGKGDPASLFTGSVEDVEIAARNLLRAPHLRRASTTLEAVQRWLEHKLTQVAGGDAAVAAILTARTKNVVAKSPLHYTSCSQETLTRFWWAAVSELLVDKERAAPPAIRARRSGSTFCPLPQQMQDLRARLIGETRRARSFAGRSNAFVRYTAVLLSLGLTLRAAGRPITVCQVPGSPDAVVVDDTRNKDPMMTRMIWLAQVVRQQLESLATHVANLGMTATNDGTLILALIDGGTAQQATLRDVLSGLPEVVAKQLPVNFARHYVRSNLIGACSTETLQALLGHWNSGTQPWGGGSGLDPLLYRADLLRSLPDLLAKDGWIPMSPPRR